MGYGIGGYLSLEKQAAFGTPVSSSPAYIPFVSESLTENKNLLTITNLRNVYDSPNDLQGTNNVTGDIVFEPHPIYLGHFLRGCITAGTVSSTLQTSAYLHEFLPAQAEFAEDCTLPPYTITIYKNVGSAYTIADGLIHTLGIEMVAGEIVKCTATVHGRAYTKSAKASPSYIAADPFTWNQVSLQVGGSANGVFESANLTITNPIDGIMALNASTNEARLLRNDFRTITIDGDQSFENQAQEAKFRDQSLQAFKFTVTGDTVVGNTGEYNQLTLDMPDVRYTTYAYPIGGPGRITAAYEAKAQYDTTSSYALRTTLQNTAQSY
ncbi:MAG: hypothetical protein GOVbin4691_41 [Prokaryotic dsDNA virus sp.]|jgi:hypothetical protein|nr:MAG: hypothetical protein GOVbin4691_41 [Prokaryotic dsDNA virus sp.]|tara:strand:+ start:1008 stop:1979 length:972 start_codon:yes stop_codon:yes gene_type:complete